MSTYYFDTSALIKNYVIETGSIWITQLLHQANEHFFVTSLLTMPEVYSALARRRRDGSVSREDYQINIDAFNDDSNRIYQFIELTLEIVYLTRQLVERYPLRANDAVQLASALTANQSLMNANLSPLIFLSADSKLSSAAIALGLLNKDPNDIAPAE